jgi:diadenosine tetraphosphatase ApaH/serine/threonine PP2A family protein phosphatase
VLGIIYDAHGNLPAVEAVIDDARAAGVERFVLGGDYALFGPWPRETVALLRELDAGWLRGNGERWTAHPGDAPQDDVVQSAVAACREALGEDTVGELAALPFELCRDGVRYVHASPRSDVRSFGPEHDDAEEELLEGVLERRLVFGHTHVQFRRSAKAGIELVNPGSAGMPFDGDPRAAYAIAADDGGEVELRRVEYDQMRTVQALRELSDAPFASKVADRIEHARFVS